MADANVVNTHILADEFDLKYRESVDRESAFEIITRANEELAALKEREAQEALEEAARKKAEAEAEKQRLKEDQAEARGKGRAMRSEN